MITLGIETSCDETAAAVVRDGRVLSSEISSSVHLHARYGGVVPEIASRFHTEFILSVTRQALADAHCGIKDIDLVAVTCKPGLPGSLLVGRAFADALSFAGKIPLIEVDHLQAHIMSCFLGARGKNRDVTLAGDVPIFPFVGMVISGGHTSMYICKSLKDFILIGRTLDDAVGEAFDKVAKILGLGYPGGPVVEERAANFTNGKEINFSRALLGDASNLDFSFSGIKTAVMYYWRDSAKTEAEKDKICFSFQEAVLDIIEEKVIRAVRFAEKTEKLAVGGGVVNNEMLRRRLASRCRRENIELCLAPREFCSDNAAMVAVLGESLFEDGKCNTENTEKN